MPTTKCIADGRGHTFEFQQPNGPGGAIVSACRCCGARLPGRGRVTWTVGAVLPELDLNPRAKDAAWRDFIGSASPPDFPLLSIPPHVFPEAAWKDLPQLNVRFGCEFYEGLVAKRADSVYPIQLRSPDTETTGWVKHRWAF
jgi:hypothetical protein